MEGSPKSTNESQKARSLPKQPAEGSAKCEANERAPDKSMNIPDKQVPANEKSKKEKKKRKDNPAMSYKLMRELRQINTMASSALIRNSRNIVNDNGDFDADSFICYICLVHEPLNHLMNHIQSEDHKRNEFLVQFSSKDIRVKLCSRCRIIMIGFLYTINRHFSTYFHKNSSRKNCKSDGPLEPPEKEFELIVKGFFWVWPELRKQFLYEVFSKFGEIKKIKVSSAFRAVLNFKDSFSVRRRLNAPVTVDGLKLTIHWREIEDSTCECENSIITELIDKEKLLGRIKELVGDQSKILYEKVKVEEASVCESLLNSLQKHYPNSICHVFGSRLTGLSFRGSDLDIYLDCDDFYYGNENDQVPRLQAVLETVAKCLRSSPEFSNITVIRNARVPLVNVKHVETGIVCDVSFKNGLAVENSALIKFMMRIDERTIPVILYVKHWMRKNGFYGRPYFSSYASTLLVLYYLAQFPNPVLPTVSDLGLLAGKCDKFIAGWNCTFLIDQRMIPETRNRNSVPELLLGFFRFYGSFDFRAHVLNTSSGKAIPRIFLKNMRGTRPPNPYQYFVDVFRYSIDSDTDSLFIMDPFDFGYNTTKNFPKTAVKKFKYLCGLTARLLRDTMQHGKGDFLI